VRNLAFISYSHQDEKWVNRLLVLLKPFLKSRRLAVWADNYVRTGDDWRREIEDGLAGARVAVLLVSPDFAASDFITEVEVPALLKRADAGELTVFCVPIAPMVPGVADLLDIGRFQWARAPDQPLDSLGEAERNAALVRIAGSLLEVFGRGPRDADQATAAPPRTSTVEPLRAELEAHQGILHGVPALPPHFVPREAALDGLKRALLEHTQQRFGISANVKTGIPGQGGLGKTVLATALANDHDIRRAFGDGVYWVTFGQRPNLVALQKSLVESLSGAPEEIESIAVGTKRLSDLLADKNTLLVLDDVWEASQAQAFDALGPRSRLLVTTRDRLLLGAIGAETCDLDNLDGNSALLLLARWADDELPLPKEAAEIVAECGRLPLALALAGAQVSKGASWGEVLAALRKGNLQFLDHPHGSVFKSMTVTLDALSPAEAARYRDLAIFPEDAAVPEAVISRLWSRAGVDERQTAELILSFHSRALLRCTTEGDSRTISVHDLQRDFLRLIAEDLPATHANLLDAYFQSLPIQSDETGERQQGTEAGDGSFRPVASPPTSAPVSARWHLLPDTETYLWQHLAHHLMGAGRAREFNELATNHRWLSAKMGVSGVAGLLTDLTSLVEFGPTPEARAVERAIRLESGWLYRDPGAFAGLIYNRLRSDGFTSRSIHETVTGLAAPPVHLRHPVHLGSTELRLYRGHAAGVMACAYSRDGFRILSASYDRTVREWDRETGQELRVFRGHAARVRACVYSTDGSHVLSASDDGTVREWDRNTGHQLCRFEGHSEGAIMCAYSPDGSGILSVSADGTIREWDRATRKTRHEYRGYSGKVAYAYSPDGSRVLLAFYDQTVTEWNQQTERELRGFQQRSSAMMACVYSSDGAQMLSAMRSGTLMESNRETGESLRTFRGHTGVVMACAYSPDGTRVVSASADGTVREWDRETEKELRCFQGHAGVVLACVYSADGTRILSASIDRTMREWDRRITQQLQPFEGNPGTVGACACSADGTRILSASDDATIREWDPETGQVVRRFEGHAAEVRACAYSNDGSRILSASNDNTLREWDQATGRELRRFEGHAHEVRACAYSPDGTRIVSASNDRTIREWDRLTGQELRRFYAHTGGVMACAYSPDESRILSALEDGTVREWDRETVREVRRFRGHKGAVMACAYSVDGSHILSASYDGSIREWDRQTGKEWRCLEGHSHSVTACTYSQDGARIFSASADGTIKVWSRADGRCLYTIYGTSGFAALAATRGGVVAGDSRGNLWILEGDLC
jgi:WD40 repeat protein